MTNCRQKRKPDTVFSSWARITEGVPQGSVLRLILFNIFLDDLPFLLKETGICSYANHSTPYICDQNLVQFINRLERSFFLLISWFECKLCEIGSRQVHILIS